MMSITSTAIIRSASLRPYHHAAQLSVSSNPVGVLQNSSFGGSWECTDHMSTEHNPTTGTTVGSKRLTPGSLAGVLT